MSVKLTNNATSLLATTIDNLVTTTSINIAPADQAKFPVITPPNDWCPIVVVDAAGNREIMRCTARASGSSTLTVDRGREGTPMLGFTAGLARVDVRLTNQAIVELLADAGLLTTGIVADAVLPPRLKPVTQQLPSNDCNAVTVTGHYLTASIAINVPVALSGYLWADVFSSLWQYQEFRPVNSPTAWARRLDNGSWLPWYKLNLTDTGVPIGTIIDYGGATAPAGWLLCYGQQLARAGTYAALFAVIGTTFNVGTVPAANFCAPDLRGRVTAGQDDMGGSAAGRIQLNADTINDMDGRILGNSGGSYLHTLLDTQISAHVHNLATITAKTATGGGDHTHTYTGINANGAFGVGAGNGGVLQSLVTAGAGEHVHTLVGDTTSVGGDKPHNNLQPTTIVNKIIKY